PSMTLNPVHTKDACSHRLRRRVMTVPPPVAVAGCVLFDRASRFDFRHPMVSEEKKPRMKHRLAPIKTQQTKGKFDCLALFYPCSSVFIRGSIFHPSSFQIQPPNRRPLQGCLVNGDSKPGAI